MRFFDAIVAGGGPAGSVAVLVLVRRGARVLHVVPEPQPAFRIGEAVPPAAWPLLRTLGLDAVARGHGASHGTVSSWGSPEPRTTDFVCDVHGRGLLLDRARFDRELRSLAHAAGATVASGRVAVVSAEHHHHAIILASGARAAAHWLIDATGRASVLARGLGARRHVQDALVALVARLQCADAPPDEDRRVFVEARPSGWWYTAGTGLGERVVAFLTDRDLVDRRLLAPDSFAAQLAATRHVGMLTRGYTISGRIRGSNASTSWLVPAAAPHWVAVGDAALAFDPLSSQGILDALYTGLRAAEAVGAALAGDDAPILAYAARVAEIRGAYLRNRANAYRAEPRWRGSPFWARRHAPLSADL